MNFIEDKNVIFVILVFIWFVFIIIVFMVIMVLMIVIIMGEIMKIFMIIVIDEIFVVEVEGMCWFFVLFFCKVVYYIVEKKLVENGL